MLTNSTPSAPEVADSDPRPTGGFLALHRRFELIVAALAIGAVAIMAVEAETATAQSAILVAGPTFGCLRRRGPSRHGPSFLQRKIRCSTVSDRLQDGADG